MDTVQIGSQFYVVRYEENGKMRILSGPYPEEWQAVSVCRLRDV